MAYSDSILTLTYDFLLYLIPQLTKFPRDQKFNLGDRIQNLAHDILDDFITAYYSGLSNEKIQRLRQANIKLERLRFSIRLSHDLKLLSNEKYEQIENSPEAASSASNVASWQLEEPLIGDLRALIVT
ncbi:MAG: four helix bundle protein [bacterium]